MGAHYFIFIWYTLLIICLSGAAMFKGHSVPDSLSFLAAFIPLAGVPLTIILAAIGSISAAKAKLYKLTLIHVAAVVVIFGLLKYIAS
ncbi:hypothetical protein DBR13_00280 [Aeromonas sp. HMWF015]|nr:hypothetical protein DBR13_00280 [Aeromonas sp. HMWF015]